MRSVRSVRAATGVLLWLIAAAAATTVGLVAVGAIGTDIFGANAQEPLSQSEVDRRLAMPPPSSLPSPTSSPPPTTSSPPDTQPPGKTTAVHSAGGTVLARCVPGGVEVVSSTPAQGYRVDHEEQGIDDHPHVRFRAGDDDEGEGEGGDEGEVEVRLRCVGGVIQPEIRTK